MRELVDQTAGRRYLPVFLNIARPMSTEEFLFSVIRRVVESLDDSGLLVTLPAAVRNSVLLAYARTSLSLTSRASEDREVARSIGVGAAVQFAGLTPKLERGTKTTRSLATEASFLTYSGADVEHDFLRIVELLGSVGSGGFGPALRRAQPVRFRRRRRGIAALPIHVVVVLDELDKLTSSEDGRVSLHAVLTAFKNVLTAPGVHFVFVAGVDLLDQAVADSRSGIGIYESVFSWTAYVPCLWQAASALVGELIRSPGRGRMVDTQIFELICDYLEYKGRGVPRRLTQELYSLLAWDNGTPYIRISSNDMNRFALYAELAEILAGLLGRQRGQGRTIEEDQFRLGAYYVTDWVLRSEGGAFKAEDVVRGERALSPLLSLTSARADLVLRHLVRHGVIESLADLRDGATLLGGITRTPSYRLSAEMRRRLLRIARSSERESVELLGVPLPADVRPTPRHPGGPRVYATSDTTMVGLAAPPAGTGSDRVDFRVPRAQRLMAGGRYELLDIIGAGGMGTVFAAVDTRTGLRRAIKVLDAPVAEGEAQARFRREAQIALRLRHRNVVRTYELLQEADGRLGIVMDLVEGSSLSRQTGESRPDGATAVRLAASILEGVKYLHELGIVRLDVKPNNVIVDTFGEPIMIDFGVARHIVDPGGSTDEEFSTMVPGLPIGTPAYMSPEQIRGERIDHRTDIYSLGKVLYVLLGGRENPDEDVPTRLYRALTQDLETSVLECSSELARVVSKATARDPEQRFQNAAQARLALLAVPETRGLDWHLERSAN
ncbi:serine/threonine-protein kinase [Frankia sp. CiP3]|uniref:serine/threonine-protein kinase n=1 Tax=Frankia sp. CiP3 TaxID=2880971 RepID=UPI001EF438AC|nr:serine/threonine-protein kinase [Frankia sp. CiP3]